MSPPMMGHTSELSRKIYIYIYISAFNGSSMSILLIYCRQIHWRVVSKPAYPPWIYMKIPFRIKSWVLHWRFVESEVGNFWSFVVGWIGRESLPWCKKKWWRSSRSNKPEWKAKSEELRANSGKPNRVWYYLPSLAVGSVPETQDVGRVWA